MLTERSNSVPRGVPDDGGRRVGFESENVAALPAGRTDEFPYDKEVICG